MHDTSDRHQADWWPLGPARGPALALSGVVLAGLITTLANGLPAAFRLAVALLVLALGAAAVRRLLRPAFTAVKIDGLRVRLRHAAGGRVDGTLAGQAFVSPLYVGLRWRQPAGRRPRSLGIFRAQMGDDDYRRLCAALRLSART